MQKFLGRLPSTSCLRGPHRWVPNPRSALAAAVAHVLACGRHTKQHTCLSPCHNPICGGLLSSHVTLQRPPHVKLSHFSPPEKPFFTAH